MKNRKYIGKRKVIGTDGTRLLTVPTFTVCASGPLKLVRIAKRGRVDPVRPLTPWECSRLMGFSPRYNFKNTTKKDAYRMIGNAVCPPIAKALMQSIVEEIPSLSELSIMDNDNNNNNTNNTNNNNNYN